MGFLQRQARADRRARHRPLHRLGHRTGDASRGRRTRVFAHRAHGRSRGPARRSNWIRTSPSRWTSPPTRTSSAASRTCARTGTAFDILVHAVAFAPREALTGTFIDATTREGFRVAHDISSYSLTALARASLPFMNGRAGAIVTLSYLGAMRSLPGYNVMGLAKASLEANVRFLAADLGRPGNPGQRHIGGPHQDALGGRHPRASQDAGARRRRSPAQAQRHHRGCRQCRGLPVLRPGGRHHRRNHLRRWRLQFRRHELSGATSA